MALGWASGLGELPRYDDLDLSRDGNYLLEVRSGGEFYNMVVVDLVAQTESTLFEGGGDKGLINWCRWGNATRVICSVRHYIAAPKLGQIASTKMFAIDIDGSNRLELVPRAKNHHRWPRVYNPQVTDRVVSWLVSDKAHILIQLNRDSRNRPTVYRLNIYNNTMSRVQRPRGMIRRWYANHEGLVRMAIGYKNNRDPQTFYVDKRQLVEYRTDNYTADIPPEPLGFSADGENVFLRMANGQDRHGIYRVKLTTGEVVEPIFNDGDFDVFGSLVMHPQSGEPVAVNYVRHHPTLVWFEPRMEALFDQISDLLPGDQMRLVSSDQAYSKFVLYTYGSVAPAYYMYFRDTHRIELIGRDFELLADEAVVDLQAVNYTTRDNVDIPAYLAVPSGDGPFPTVLLPHGGPYARDSAEFDPWVQYLVERGIAVLKPNYRGSVGYGQAHMQAGYKEWGKRMQHDLLDGLEWMVQEGHADPDRVCVVGASYGGYSALVSAFKFSDRIACAVSLAGISDLQKMVERLYNFDLAERNRERIQGPRELKNNSPIVQAEYFNVPVLMLHGGRDTVVRVTQSRRLAEKLKKLGKNYRYVEQPLGDHFLSLASQRREFFDEMGMFLDRHLKVAKKLDGNP